MDRDDPIAIAPIAIDPIAIDPIAIGLKRWLFMKSFIPSEDEFSLRAPDGSVVKKTIAAKAKR